MLIRVILLGILLTMIARAFWRVVEGIVEGASGGRPRQQMRRGMKLVRDPVCGTFVVPGTALSLPSQSGTHYFCSEACRRRFADRS